MRRRFSSTTASAFLVLTIFCLALSMPLFSCQPSDFEAEQSRQRSLGSFLRHWNSVNPQEPHPNDAKGPFTFYPTSLGTQNVAEPPAVQPVFPQPSSPPPSINPQDSASASGSTTGAAASPTLSCGGYNGRRVYSVLGNRGEKFLVVRMLNDHRAKGSRDFLLEAHVACAFDALRQAALTSGWSSSTSPGENPDSKISLRIRIGFRSLKRQKAQNDCLTADKNGRDCNNAGGFEFVPQVGYSPYGRGTRVAFDIRRNSKEYAFLKQFAHLYGFIRVDPRDVAVWEYSPKSQPAPYT